MKRNGFLVGAGSMERASVANATRGHDHTALTIINPTRCHQMLMVMGVRPFLVENLENSFILCCIVNRRAVGWLAAVGFRAHVGVVRLFLTHDAHHAQTCTNTLRTYVRTYVRTVYMQRC